MAPERRCQEQEQLHFVAEAVKQLLVLEKRSHNFLQLIPLGEQLHYKMRSLLLHQVDILFI